MLLIQKGKPTRKYCDRCHQRSRGELCENCRPNGEPTEQEWREIRRIADGVMLQAQRFNDQVRRNA